MSAKVTTSRRSSPSLASWTLPRAVVARSVCWVKSEARRAPASDPRGRSTGTCTRRPTRLRAGHAEQGDDEEQEEGDGDGDGPWPRSHRSRGGGGGHRAGDDAASGEAGLHDWRERYHAGNGRPIEPTGPDQRRFRPASCDVPVSDSTTRGPGRARRAARRARVAGHPPRDHAGPAGAPRDGPADLRLHRLRPHRPSRSTSATSIPIFGLIRFQRSRRPAGRARRRRDGDDRRPVGAVVGAEPARRADARAQRGLDPRAAGAVPGLLAGPDPGRAGEQPRLARASCR